MEKLNFPSFPFRLRSSGNRSEIFDPVRKRYVALTPEEWVRQHLIAFLHTEKGISLQLMACEKGLLVNRIPRRFDLLIFNASGKPSVIAECKAPSVPLSDSVFYQALQYNLALKVDYLLVTNGIQHFVAKVDYETGTMRFLESIPDAGML